jgi:site-specific DNA recombinase
MSAMRIALYARVSSEKQATERTIASQLADLHARIAGDGLTIEEEHRYLDDGGSATTLVRPGMERLRDAVARGLLDRLYLHDPDRLARSFLDQLLLVQEFEDAGVEVIFLNHPLGRTPEDRLLLQIQGSVAEFERTKILERCRRGKRYAAQQGEVRALSSAPYGYRYIPKAEGGGQARYEIVLPEAQTVRQIFAWVAEERCSSGEVCRRLAAAGLSSPGGTPRWQRATIRDLVTNPAYRGQAAFGRSRVVTERSTRGLRVRQRRVAVPEEEWLFIPVPPLVSAQTFAAAAEQLAGEQRRVQPGASAQPYLLTGVIRCAVCGMACVGHTVWKRGAGGTTRVPYRYYRCQGSDRRRTGGERVCERQLVRIEPIDAAVWAEVARVLADPAQVLVEYQRRLADDQVTEQQDLAPLERQLRQARAGRGRLIDSYTEGMIEQADFGPRITRFDERIRLLEQQRQEAMSRVEDEAELRLVIGRLEDFAGAVTESLASADHPMKRQLIATLVKRVELDVDCMRVVFRIGHGPDPPPASLHFWTHRLCPP